MMLVALNTATTGITYGGISSEVGYCKTGVANGFDVGSYAAHDRCLELETDAVLEGG